MDIFKNGTMLERRRRSEREFPSEGFDRRARAGVTPYVYTLICVHSIVHTTKLATSLWIRRECEVSR